MSFSGGGLYYAENNKQHLNLSVQAYEVIQSDMFTFREEKLSGFINRIFESYSPAAEASVSRTLNRMQGDLAQLLEGIKGDNKTKERIIEVLLQKEKNRLIEKSLSYEKGKAFKFWLNKKNLVYLTEAESECGEENYYADHRGKYIKSVLEEYTRLPYVQRERIYFSPFIEEIKSAVQKQCQLRVMTGNDKVYSVYPYEILCDYLSTANYLVGYSKRYSHPEDDMRPCSFRISALVSVKAEKSKSAFLKADQRKELSRTIAARGVQFMSTEGKEIHVRLTEAGKVKFQRQVHLRPAFIRRQENIYVFQCTEAQAQFYFFKFGEDAEILQPEALREKFKTMYERAASVYESK